MELEYLCTGTKAMTPAHWKGYIHLINSSQPDELKVTARNGSFHILCGKHAYGNFICIPNWNIGTQLAELSDCFGNREQLTTDYPHLSQVDIISIVNALVKLSEYLSSQEKAG